MSASQKLFESSGAISEHLDNYEVRPQQIQMVKAVEDAIEGPDNLIVEAGTGVGKSLAYLVPFINWAVKENKKVAISTYTKALQHQLFVKDLPFLSRVMDVDFRYSLCMGSDNYVCLRKAGGYAPDMFETDRRKEQAERIKLWLSATETGLRTDMDFVPDGPVWAAFSRESDVCLNKNCRHKSKCFHRNARKEQSGSHILIVNHSLLFSDMVSEAHVLPDYHGLVLDEAHTLEDVATTHFSSEISNTAIHFMTEDISRFVSGKTIGREGLKRAADEVSEVKERVEKLRQASDKFFCETLAVFGEENGTRTFDRNSISPEGLKEPLTLLSQSLMNLGRIFNHEEEHASLDTLSDDKPLQKARENREVSKAYMKRCLRFSEAIDFIFGKESGEYVYWIDIKERKKGKKYSFNAAPIDISEQMKVFLFDRVCPVILTSATLTSTGGGETFSFIEERLGLEDPLELILDSPFDYKSNVLMYIPKSAADPNRDINAYRDYVQENVTEIYDIMGGRIFTLFTSYDMLNKVSERIAFERPDINMLKQGDLPRYVLLDVFKKSRESMLMGTTTFWQGVDVPGSALECVIITKLPFTVPSEPINAARIKALKDRGENPFYDYQLPQAVIMFKQGFGRLIRGKSDRGVVAVLDPRVRTRSYGTEFIKAVPGTSQTSNIQDVRDFFNHPILR